MTAAPASSWHAWALVGLAAVTATVAPVRLRAQPAPTPASASASASAPASARPASSAGPARAASSPSQRIEITGGRDSDTEARRRSTAARIVIGREEIDKFGDATTGEVLRRLPGITTPGAPGRGGPPRMRGLGSGYTQLLIDGQRVPPGFDLNSLPPDQIERIEILRAPTAETGARAIAGTINIVLREGYRRRVNDLRLGFGVENDAVSPGVQWTRNDTIGDAFIYNLSLSLFKPHRTSGGESDTTQARADDGTVLGNEHGMLHSDEHRRGVALNSRLQWRLGAAGDVLLLTPSIVHNEGRTTRRFSLAQTVPGGPATSYDLGDGETSSRYTAARLNGQWRQRLGDALRMEWSGGLGGWRSASDTGRREYASAGPTLLRTTDDLGRTRERSASLTAKFSGIAGGGEAAAGGPASREHSLVGGIEFEGVRRDETRVYTQNGTALLTDFGDAFSAATMRAAAYLQDEWSLSANWAFHAGLRTEMIRTRGDAIDGTRPVNTSSVTTPLLHLLWKPDPARRDQVRLSLTRSYRAPGTGSLIARPSLNTRAPTHQTNTPTTPDGAGNPDLKPELSIGIDLAFERYLEGGGVLSANVFRRRISDLIRNVTRLETVTYATVSPLDRYVARPQNIGDAVTQGIELEAKYRLDQLLGAGVPPVELRHSLAVYRSRVDGVPGPDNRLDQQARLVANVGGDYRLRGTPLTLGGNLNWVPGYRTQLADDKAVTVSGKRIVDVFALWTFTPELALRVLANNAAPRDYASRTEFSFEDPRRANLPIIESANTYGPSYTNWQIRLEMKL